MGTLLDFDTNYHRLKYGYPPSLLLTPSPNYYPGKKVSHPCTY